MTRALRLAAFAAALAAVASCMPQPRAAVSLHVTRHAKTPADAFVTIDEQYLGPLAYVAAHGVRLPLGKHRITVERTGYFPYDTIVDADDRPISLDIQLKPIPD
jgi:hypothetical protein